MNQVIFPLGPAGLAQIIARWFALNVGTRGAVGPNQAVSGQQNVTAGNPGVYHENIVLGFVGQGLSHDFERIA